MKSVNQILLSICLLWTTASFAIDAPRDPRGTEIGQAHVKWEWAPVSDAANYEVIVDGTHIAQTRDAQYHSYNLWAGEHSLTVRAIDGSGQYSASTQTIKIIVNAWFSSANHSRSFLVEYDGAPVATAVVAPPPPAPVAVSIPVDQPTNVRGTMLDASSIKWEWSSAEGANTYDISVDGGYAGTTQDTSFTSYDLWEGDHSMTVVAVGETGNVSQRSATAKTWAGTVVVEPEPVAESVVVSSAPPPPAGDPDAASVESMIDPASYGHSEVSRMSDYELVFSDEFEGTALNPYRWNTGLRWDGEYNGERYEYRVINGEDQFYVNIFSEDEEHIREVTPAYNPFELDGSRLAIRATKNPLKTTNGNKTFGSMQEIVVQQQFLSGAITTHDKFSQKYGYFEARIKLPSHIGTFPAFWLFHENRAWEGTQRTEIDIMENLGHAPWYVYNSFHYFKNVTTTYGGDAHFVKPYPNGQVYTGTDYSQDYHVYAVKWEPGKIIWYIDDEKVSELEHNEVNHEALYLKLNLAMGGNWTSFPANAGGLGRSYPTQGDLDSFADPALEIDYVRIYKKR